MEVFHGLLSDKWTGGQEIGFSPIKECEAKIINNAETFKRFINKY